MAYWLMSAEKIRFLVIGGLNTIVGLFTYPIVYLVADDFNFHYLQVLAISQFLCINFSFCMNKWFVFKTKNNYLKEYLKFCTFHSIHILINFGLLPILVEVFAIQPIIAQLSFSIIVIVSSYFWYSRITFFKKKSEL